MDSTKRRRERREKRVCGRRACAIGRSRDRECIKGAKKRFEIGRRRKKEETVKTSSRKIPDCGFSFGQKISVKERETRLISFSLSFSSFKSQSRRKDVTESQKEKKLLKVKGLGHERDYRLINCPAGKREKDRSFSLSFLIPETIGRSLSLSLSPSLPLETVKLFFRSVSRSLTSVHLTTSPSAEGALKTHEALNVPLRENAAACISVRALKKGFEKESDGMCLCYGETETKIQM